jgi:ABC-2 type transport system ATP-binding protein
MIRIDTMNFSYGTDAPVMRRLSASFASGSIHGILGRNGAGKSTLLKLLAGLAKPCSGRVSINGADPFRRDPVTLSNIAMLAEEVPASRLNIREYARLYGRFHAGFSIETFRASMSRFDVDAERPLRSLSLGERKKAMLAFLLSTGARLLLLDEPTNGLDIEAKATLRAVLLDYLEADRTVIIATHNVRELDDMLDHVSILDRGSLALHASVHDLTLSLTFASGAQAPSQALYAERRAGRFAYVLAGADPRHARADLEILFRAVLQNPEHFAAMGAPAHA